MPETRQATLSEISALIRLLDDPAPVVHEAVMARLHELGRTALPFLRSAQSAAAEPLRSQLAEVTHDLHFLDIEGAWKEVMSNPESELERGVFLLALYRFPDLNLHAYQTRLDEIANQIRPRIQAARGVGRAFVLSSYLCNELGFTGNNEHYADPNNSYINCVMDTRRGIPVSLSVVFLLLARRLDLPIYGVNMPAHFLTKYMDERHEVFFDLFNGGTPLMREQCAQFLTKAGIHPLPRYFKAASGQTVLLRMVCNLLAVAQESNRPRYLSDLTRLMEPWNPNSSVT